jgi:hypothetical protein
MGKPHPYAEVIKAWADGAEVQYYDCNKWWDWNTGWTAGVAPTFTADFKWRVKPIKRVCRIALLKDGPFLVFSDTSVFDSALDVASPDFVKWLTDWIEYEVD